MTEKGVGMGGKAEVVLCAGLDEIATVPVKRFAVVTGAVASSGVVNCLVGDGDSRAVPKAENFLRLAEEPSIRSGLAADEAELVMPSVISCIQNVRHSIKK
jgi:hypothetical protein